jgi:glycosyltransferase involved in cell wall biosynthesis
MKLIIQIPCYNEASTLSIALSALPREVPGADTVEWLIIDDGSTDRTSEVALSHGVDHIVRLKNHQGLAKAFMAGIHACLEAGADVIVNTDADNQYNADDIPRLIEPILSGKAEIVIGSRPVDEIKHFSLVKKYLQKIGSWVVRIASNTKVPDAPSGFRAFSRTAALQINVFDRYTYTLETIIQAGQKGLPITSVPIRTNKCLRPSRLVKNTPHYIMRSINTIIRIFVTYRPFRFFAVPGVISFCLGLLISVRFLYFYFIGNGSGHVQSLILSALLLGIGVSLLIMGLIADLISVNRRLLEKLDWQLKKVEERMKKDKTYF